MLGIEKVEWTPGLNGEAAAASGVRMRPADLARIGQLLLQRGQWNGRAVGSAGVDRLVPHAPRGRLRGRAVRLPVVRRATRDGSLAYMGIGLGGQRLVVVPALELVYVIFMGNYYRADQLKSVFAVQDLIHASLR